LDGQGVLKSSPALPIDRGAWIGRQPRSAASRGRAPLPLSVLAGTCERSVGAEARDRGAPGGQGDRGSVPEAKDRGPAGESEPGK